MVVQVLCNIVMFAAYILNIVYMVYVLRSIPKGLTNLDELCVGMSKKETCHFHQKRFTNKFFKLLLVTLIFLAVGVVTCLLDGLSNMENPPQAPFFAGIFMYPSLFLVLFVYSLVVQKKYKLVMTYLENGVQTASRAQMIACVFTSGLFAINTAMVAYTICLLL